MTEKNFQKNKNFISSKEASKLTKYTSDYVGQLCREGKVEAKKIHRSWYVSKDSLLAYVQAEAENKSQKNSSNSFKPLEDVSQVVYSGEIRDVSENKVISDRDVRKSDVVFREDKSSLLPELHKIERWISGTDETDTIENSASDTNKDLRKHVSPFARKSIGAVISVVCFLLVALVSVEGLSISRLSNYVARAGDVALHGVGEFLHEVKGTDSERTFSFGWNVVRDTSERLKALNYAQNYLANSVVSRALSYTTTTDRERDMGTWVRGSLLAQAISPSGFIDSVAHAIYAKINTVTCLFFCTDPYVVVLPDAREDTSPQEDAERVAQNTDSVRIIERVIESSVVTQAPSVSFPSSAGITRQEFENSLISLWDEINSIPRTVGEGGGQSTIIYQDVVPQEFGIGGDKLTLTGVLYANNDAFFDVDTLVIDSTNNRVGIGTTSPFAKFSVAGDSYISGTLDVGGINISGSQDVGGSLSITGTTTFGGPLVPTADNTIDIGSGADWLRFRTGYFGTSIGIGGTATSTGTGITADGAYAIAASTTLALLTNGTERFSIDQSGNVGIGTTSPSATFAVSGNGYVTGGFGIGVATTAPGVLQTTGGIYTTGDIYGSGNLTVTGTTTLGVSITDTLTINSLINSDLLPDQNAIRNIGSPSYYWNDLYVDTITANNISAASTSIGGTQSNTFTINSDNATADTEDASIIFYRGTVVPNALITWDATRDRFDFNQPLFIQNDASSTTIPTLRLQASATQTADVFNVLSFGGNPLFNVGVNGNVGIGTSSPFAKFSVVGDGYVAGGLTTGGLIATSSVQFSSLGKHMLLSTDGSGNILATSTPQVASITATSTTATSTFPNLAITGAFNFLGDYITNVATWFNGLFDTQLATKDTGDLTEGSNLYWTNTRFDERLSATTTLPNITTLANLTTVGTITSGVWNGSTIPVAYGGTGQTSFGQGWLHSDGTTLTSSTSPTVAYLTATSTTATSTFAGGLVAGGGSLNVLQNGNVGIGTSTPGFNFAIEQSSSQTTPSLWVGDTRGDTFNVYTAQNSVVANLLTSLSDTNSSVQFNLRKGSGVGALTMNFASGATNRGSIGVNGSNEFFLTGGNATDFRFSVGNSSNFLITTGASSNISATAGSIAGSGTLTLLGTSATSGNTAGLVTSTGEEVYLRTASTTRLTIDVNGNVGIGTTTPWGKLSVTNTGTGPSFIVEDTASPDTSPFIIDASGNVGVGTASPISKLYVADLGNNNEAALSIGAGINAVNDWTGIQFGYNDGSALYHKGGVFFQRTGTFARGSLLFATNNEANTNNVSASDVQMTITTAGNVGIGTTTPLTALDVVGVSSFGDGSTTSNGLTLWGNDSIRAIVTGFRKSYFGVANHRTGTNSSAIVIDGSTTKIHQRSTGIYAWTNNSTNGDTTLDTGLSRNAAGVVEINSGTAGAIRDLRVRALNPGGENVGIGTTSPYAKLSVAGQTVAEYFTATSTTATSTFAGGLVAGNGSLNVLQNGNVGIGTASPVGKLEVGNLTSWSFYGYVNIGNQHTSAYSPAGMDTSGEPGLVIQNTNNSADYSALRLITRESSQSVWEIANEFQTLYQGDLAFKSRTGVATYAERLRITNGGNVGIGSTTPWGKLSVTNTGTGPSFIVEDSASPDSTPFVIDASGNVGVGTAAPSYDLQVVGTTTVSALNVLSSDSTITNNFPWSFESRNENGTRGALYIGANYTQSRMYIGTPQFPLFALNLSNVDRIESPPDINMGSNELSFGGPSISIERVSNGLRLDGGGTGGANLTGITFNVNDDSFTEGDVTTAMRILGDGRVGIGTTSPYAKLSVVGETVAEYFTATSTTATSTLPLLNISNALALNGKYFTDLQGSGLSLDSGTLSVSGVSPSSLALTEGYTFVGGSDNTATATSSLFVSSAGNVGIGTVSPTSLLHVQNPVNGEDSVFNLIRGGGTYGLQFRANYSGGHTLIRSLSGNGVNAGNLTFETYNGSSYQDNLTLHTGGNSYFRIGNLGIGTTTPWGKLSVTNTGTGPSFIVEDSASPDSSPFVIDASGNVGIGTVTPATNLHVEGVGGTRGYIILGTADTNGIRLGAADATAGVVGTYKGDGTTKTGIKTTFVEDFNSSNWRLGTGAALSGGNTFNIGWSAFSYFSTNDVNISRLSANTLGVGTGAQGSSAGTIIAGNIGIGTTSPYAKLSVAGQTVAEYFTATSTTATSTFYGDINKYAYNGTSQVATIDSITGTAVGTGDSNYLGRLKLNNPSNSGTNTGGVIDFAYGGTTRARISTIISGGNSAGIDFWTSPSGVLTKTYSLRSDGTINHTAQPATTEGATTSILSVTNSTQVTAPVSVVRLLSGQTSIGNVPLLEFSPISSTGGFAESRRAAAIGAKKFANTNSDFKVGLSFYTFEGSTGSGGAASIPGTFSEKMVLDSAGNLGIGTTSPYAKLSVVGETVAEYFTATSTTATSTLPLLNVSNALALNGKYFTDLQGSGLALTSGVLSVSGVSPSSLTLTEGYTFVGGSDNTATATSTLFVSSAGNVGVGTVSPMAKFQVVSDSYSNSARLDYINSNATSPTLLLQKARGSVGSLSEVQTGDEIGTINFKGYAPSATNANAKDSEDYISFGKIVSSYRGNSGKGGMAFYVRKDWGYQDPRLVLDINERANVGINQLAETTAQLAITPDYLDRVGIRIRSYSGQTANLQEWLNSGGTTIASVSSAGGAYFTNNLGIGTTSPFAKLAVTNSGAGHSFLVEDTTSPDSSPFVIDASGNVGVGTAAPVFKLDVTGYGRFTSGLVGANGDAGIRIARNVSDAASTAHYVDVGYSGISAVTNGHFTIDVTRQAGISNKQYFAVKTSPATGSSIERMRIDGDGNVGIGVGSASALLHVSSTTPFADMFKVTAGASTFVVDATGNTGIGTTSPYAKLSVVGETVAEYFTATSTTATSTFAGGLTVDGNNLLVDHNTGFVGVGLATPSTKFHVVLGGTAEGTPSLGNGETLRVQRNNVAASTASISVIAGSQGKAGINFGDNSNASSGIISYDNLLDALFINTNAIERMRITNAGDVGIGTTTPWGKLSVTNTGTGPSFIVEDTTSPDSSPFVIDASGNVGIGTTGPAATTHIISTGSGDILLVEDEASIDGSPFVINEDGAVGIGTRTPAGLFNVKGSFTGSGEVGNIVLDDTDSQATGTGGAITFRGVYTGSSLTQGAQIKLMKTNNTAGNFSFGLAFQTRESGSAMAERMIIDHVGNIGIGTTSPYAKLSVAGQTVAEYFTATSTTATSTFAGRLQITRESALDGSDPAKLWISSTRNGTWTDGAEMGSLQFTSRDSSGAWTPGVDTVRAKISTLVDTNGSISNLAFYSGDQNANLTEVFRTSGARLGIGTTSTPLGKVHILTNQTNLPTLYLERVSSQYVPIIKAVSNLAVDLFTVTHTGAGYFADNVGVATSTPWGKLSITNTGTGPSFIVEDSASPDSSPFVIDASGNVGVGTAAPGEKLDVVGNLRTTGTAYLGWDAATSKAWVEIDGTSNGQIRLKADGGHAQYLNITARGDTTGPMYESNTTHFVKVTPTGGAATSPINVLGLMSNYSSTPGDGFGINIPFYSKTNGNNRREIAYMSAILTNATDATRSSAITFSTMDNASAITERVRIDSLGNIGIGTTSPYAKLSVVGETVAEYFTATSTTATSTFAGGLVAGNGSLNVLQNGNVGVGTVVPLDKLQVYGSVTMPKGNSFGFRQGSGAGSVVVSYGADFSNNAILTSSGNFQFNSIGGGTGNVGIGTTSPWGKLSVTNTGTGPSFIVEDSASPDSSPFVIDASGNVGVGTAAPTSKLTVLSVGTVVEGQATSTANSTLTLSASSGLPSLAFLNSSNELSYINFDRTGGYSVSSGSAGHGVNFRSGRSGNFSNYWFRDSNDNVGIGFVQPGYGSASMSTLAGMNLLVGGNLGIGTTTPYGKLSVTNTGTGPSFIVEDTASPDSSPFVIDADGNVGVGTASPSEKLHVVGNGLFTGTVTGSNLNQTQYSVAVPTTVGEAIGFATVTNTNFSSNVEIWYTVHSSGYAQSKRYIVPVQYNGTAGAWHKALPISTTGVYGANDAEIDVRVYTNTAEFRVRRTGGTTAGTAYITLAIGGDLANTTVTATSSAFASATVSANYAPTSLTMKSGKTGINNDSPTAFLDIVGTTEQLRVGYDGSNYNSFTVGSAGSLNIATVGTNPNITLMPAGSGKIGIGTTDPYTKLQIGTPYSDTGMDTDALSVFHSTPVSATVLNDSKNVLYLGRMGTFGQSYGTGASFAISRWENNGTNSRARLDIKLAHGAWNGASGDNILANVMTLLSNGNVGIGTTSPYAKLSVVGETVAEYFTATSTTATSTFAGGATFATGGGNVGIGTDTPDAKLQVSGGDIYLDTGMAIRNASFPTYDYFSFTSGGSTGFNAIGNLSFKWNTDGGGGNEYVNFVAGGTELARIDSLTGNMGIGTTSPYAKLSVVGETVSEFFTATSTTATSTFAGGATFATGGGLVGIGTSTPSKLLTVSGNVDTTGLGFGESPVGIELANRWASTVPSREATIVFSQYAGVNTSRYAAMSGLVTGSSGEQQIGDIVFSSKTAIGDTALTERMRITSGGNIGIGTSSPYAKLSFGGEPGANESMLSFGNPASGLTNGAFISVNVESGQNSDFFNYQLNGNSRFRANSSGDLTISGGFSTNSSNGYQIGIKTRLGGNVGLRFNSTLGIGWSGDGNYGTSLDVNLSRISSGVLGVGNGTIGDSSGTLIAGNIGIGTTSSFAKLSVHANDGETNASLFSVASSTASATTTHLTVLNNGNIGINVAQPANRLDVSVGNDSNFGYALRLRNGFGGDFTTTGVLFEINNNIAKGALVYRKMGGWGRGDFHFLQNTTANTDSPTINDSVLTITNAGNLGIGTTSPYAKLSVVGEAVASYFTATSTTATSTFAGGFNVDSGGFVYDHNTGFVGVGTSAPAEEFTVSKHQDASTVIRVENTHTGGTNQLAVLSAVSSDGNLNMFSAGANYTLGGLLPHISDSAVIQAGNGLSGGLQLIAQDTSGPIRFYAGGIGAIHERARVTSAGNFGIGTATPAYKLDVYRTGDGAVASFTDANGVCTINPTSTALSCSSDRTLKKDIESLDQFALLDKVSELNTVSYRWKTEDGSQPVRLGFIAQDVEDIFPEFVTEGPNGKKAVSYGSFTPVLASAIQAIHLDVMATSTMFEGTERLTLIGRVVAYFESVGLKIKDGVIAINNLMTDTIVVGSSEKPTGITLYDEVTGDPYCLSIQNGAPKSTAGVCGSTQVTSKSNDTNDEQTSGNSSTGNTNDIENSENGGETETEVETGTGTTTPTVETTETDTTDEGTATTTTNDSATENTAPDTEENGTVSSGEDTGETENIEGATADSEAPEASTSESGGPDTSADTTSDSSASGGESSDTGTSSDDGGSTGEDGGSIVS